MRQQFITATVFDLIIGNNDGHAKNFSLLYQSDGAVNFAPRYDLVPIRLFEGYTEQFSYDLGQATKLEELTAEDFDLFLHSIGIESRAGQKRLRNSITSYLGNQFADQIETLEKSGQKKFANLIASNIRHLFAEFNLEIPEPVRDRDAVIVRGGDWHLPS